MCNFGLQSANLHKNRSIFASSVVLAKAVGLIIAGAAVGIAVALGVTRLLASFLYGVKAGDPITLVAVSCLLGPGSAGSMLHSGASRHKSRSSSGSALRITGRLPDRCNFQLLGCVDSLLV